MALFGGKYNMTIYACVCTGYDNVHYPAAYY